ncbi:MAG: hypothetical protein JEZ09_13510 [Salinivirgaceae bacterium]|nr:hypothetical protein [Salinivirgaceae bacterium]
MKKLILVLILFVGAFFKMFGQNDANIVRIAGLVFSEKYNTKAAYVHIVNKRSGMGVISDSVGIFKINIQKTDTLLFHCLGFEGRIFTIPDTVSSKVLFASINLKPISYNIDEIDVMALTSKNQFKYDFVNMESDLTEKRIMIPGVTKYLEKEESIYPVAFTGMSPITALYYHFSKEGKSLNKLVELREQDEIDRKVALKYNNDVLFDISGYSEDTLQAFYNHLQFTNSYVLSAESYSIYKRINDSLPLFNLHLSKDTAFFSKCFSK